MLRELVPRFQLSEQHKSWVDIPNPGHHSSSDAKVNLFWCWNEYPAHQKEDLRRNRHLQVAPLNFHVCRRCFTLPIGGTTVRV